jgi:hypothetical protein
LAGIEYISAVNQKINTSAPAHNPFEHGLLPPYFVVQSHVPRQILLIFISVLGKVVYFIVKISNN